MELSQTEWFSGDLLAACVRLRTQFLAGFDRLRGVSVRISRALLTIGFAPVLLAGLFAPSASAAVPLGGGAGIMVDGTLCTLTTIGHDNTGDLVGFTAGHCGGPGAEVSAEGTPGAVGTVVATDDYLDYAVIKFDPAKVAPTANFAGFAINGLGPDPQWRQRTCTLGAATGNYCSGIVTMPVPGPARTMPAPYEPGDDGRPVTADDLLIGLAHRAFIEPGDPFYGHPIPETKVILFSAVLNDIAAKGSPGAGFTPVPPA